MNLSLLATTSSADSGSAMFLSLMYLVVAVAFLAALWKTFKKAKQPGWGAIIPIYNLYLILKIAGRPGWWILLYLVPIVNLVVHILVSLDVAKAFKKSQAFGIVAIWLIPIVGYMILGFGDAKFKGSPKH